MRLIEKIKEMNHPQAELWNLSHGLTSPSSALLSSGHYLYQFWKMII